MWDRAILKENAKMALSGGRYWTAYAVCVISSLIVGCFSVINGFFETKPDYVAMNADPYESSIYCRADTWRVGNGSGSRTFF